VNGSNVRFRLRFGFGLGSRIDCRIEVEEELEREETHMIHSGREDQLIKAIDSV
jgi:hypothetical protein